jgi:hypothetical protein
MVRVAVSQAAFEAVAAIFPLVRVVHGPERNAMGERLIWVERFALEPLRAVRPIVLDLHVTALTALPTKRATVYPVRSGMRDGVPAMSGE